MMEKEFVDLYTLQTSLRAGLEDLFPGRVWVRAEIASISVKSNGHCYLELSQDRGGQTVAKARAVIWRSRYGQINAFIQAATGAPLKAGTEVLAEVQVTYSELYGLSLTINDIDPQFTLGQREMEKRRTIERLQREGLMDMQARLELPLLPYALAIVSAEGAAGLGDFLHHLHGNEYGFVFHTELFQATMQGEGAPASIVDALDRIEASGVAYDAVLMMRGGGSDLDLACFDDYGLASRIARCRLPVFTAIGHDKDVHVADMVAHASVKTPTALADAFIDCFAGEDERIASFTQRLRLAFVGKVNMMANKVDLLESRIAGADPRRLLERGYTLVADGGGVIRKSAAAFRPGDRMSVLLADGRVECRVEEVKEGR